MPRTWLFSPPRRTVLLQPVGCYQDCAGNGNKIPQRQHCSSRNKESLLWELCPQDQELLALPPSSVMSSPILLIQREKYSESFGCFALPSPPSRKCREDGEGSARNIHIFDSPHLSPVLHSRSPPATPPAGAAQGEVALGPQAPTGPFFFGAAASPSPTEAPVAMQGLLWWAPAQP